MRRARHSLAFATTPILALTLACSHAGPPVTVRPRTQVSSAGEVAPSIARRVADTMRVVLEKGTRDSAFPGAFAIVGNHAGIVARIGVGHLDWATSPAVDGNTMWDLASLTKVVGMTSAMMQLVEQGKVDVNAPVQRYLPDWVGPNKERVTVRHLLTHASGLPAWRPLYKEATDAASAMRLVYATPLDTLPGVRMVYSDLGAILLGEIVRRVSGEPLDVYLPKRVFGPLGMTSTMYKPPASMLDRIAWTEFDPWRRRHLHGEVHDENCAMLGGVTGHAGLFSTGEDLARLAMAYLNHGTLDGRRVFSPDVIARFTTIDNASLSNRALGWEKPTGANSGGHKLSASAFGHTGFTGTSIWIDPERDAFVILLTNRVNPTRQNSRIGGVRIALADAVMTALASDPSSTTRP